MEAWGGFPEVPCDLAPQKLGEFDREGYTLERADAVFSEIENRLSKLPGVTNRFAVIGENSNSAGKGQGDVTRGSIYLRLTDLENRTYTQFDVMERARTIMKDYPDLRSAVSDVSSIQAAGQDNRVFQLLLSGPELDKLSEYSEKIIHKLRQLPGLTDVDDLEQHLRGRPALAGVSEADRERLAATLGSISGSTSI